jgi:hypothetical protein
MIHLSRGKPAGRSSVVDDRQMPHVKEEMMHGINNVYRNASSFMKKEESAIENDLNIMSQKLKHNIESLKKKEKEIANTLSGDARKEYSTIKESLLGEIRKLEVGINMFTEEVDKDVMRFRQTENKFGKSIEDHINKYKLEMHKKRHASLKSRITHIEHKLEQYGAHLADKEKKQLSEAERKLHWFEKELMMHAKEIQSDVLRLKRREEKLGIEVEHKLKHAYEKARDEIVKDVYYIEQEADTILSEIKEDLKPKESRSYVVDELKNAYRLHYHKARKQNLSKKISQAEHKVVSIMSQFHESQPVAENKKIEFNPAPSLRKEEIINKLKEVYGK